MLGDLAYRLRALLRRNAVEAEMNDELRFHLEQEAAKLINQGLPREEAQRRARLAFGVLDEAREECREARGVAFIETTTQDLRYGLRQLRRNARFAVVAIVTLALGIGATTTIFSVVNAVLLQPLPYKQANRLVIIRELIRKASPEPMNVSAPDIAVIQRDNMVFTAVAGFQNRELNLSGAGEPVRLDAARVSASLFSILGASPLLGRTFTLEEDQPGHAVTILSYGLWQRHFGGDPTVIGRSVTLGGQLYTVIGVMPKTFEFPPRGMPGYATAELWVPIALTREELADIGDNFDIGVLARLKWRITLEQARANMSLVAGAIQKTWGPEALSMGLRLETVVTPFREQVIGTVRRLMVLLLSAVALLLLLACANVASLLLCRAATRRREIALREALGAGQGRIVRQLLTESVLLALLGGSLGVLLSLEGVKLLVALVPETIPQVGGVGVDGTVLLFALLISMGTGLLFGLAPALAAARSELVTSIKEGGRVSGGGRSAARARSGFVVAQVAIACVLAISAGLLTLSFIHAEETDPGLRPQNLLTATIALPPAQYSSANQVVSFFDQLFLRMDGMGGVKAIGAATDLPTETNWNHAFTAEEHPTPAKAEEPFCWHSLVLGNYFQALGVPLIRGRFFTSREIQGQSKVVLVSAGMARRYWPGEDPVGKRLKWGPNESHSPWLTVVGVVGDVKQRALDQPTESHTYAPYRQDCSNQDVRSFGLCTSLNVAVRARATSETVAQELRSKVQRIDPAEPLTQVRTMTDILENSIAPRRFNTFLLGVFGGAALFLAAIGLYSMLAYQVTQQTHEIGIRMALGARRVEVLRRVVAQGLRLTLIGIGIGIPGAFGLTRLMASLLYGTSSTDPATFVAVSLLLCGVALAACYVPARRAAKVDPAVALRSE